MVQQLRKSLVTFYQPPPEIPKYGFKEIGVQGLDVLEELKATFPTGYILFSFRDPLQQYISIKSSGYFDYSAECSRFLSVYERLSNIYLRYYRMNSNSLFVENTSLKQPAFVLELIRFLGLSCFDRSLINDQLDSTTDLNLTPGEEEQIHSSGAMKNYRTMKSLAVSFVNTPCIV